MVQENAESRMIAACLRQLSLGVAAGDVEFLLDWLKRASKFQETGGSRQQHFSVQMFARRLELLEKFEVLHGAGSALNIDHPAVKELIKRRYYDDDRVHNAVNATYQRTAVNPFEFAA